MLFQLFLPEDDTYCKFQIPAHEEPLKYLNYRQYELKDTFSKEYFQGIFQDYFFPKNYLKSQLWEVDSQVLTFLIFDILFLKNSSLGSNFKKSIMNFISRHKKNINC